MAAGYASCRASSRPAVGGVRVADLGRRGRDRVGTTVAGAASEHLGAGAGFLIGAFAPLVALALALAFLRSAR